jgi:tetratricopeptide (TPR) repeat protein
MIELDPSDAYAYVARSEMYVRQDELDRALGDANKAIELDSGAADGYVRRGRVYTLMDEYDKALQDDSRVVELEPGETEGYLYRGADYVALEEYEKALADFSRAIELDPSCLQAYVSRADTHILMEELEAAAADLKTALALADTVEEIAEIEHGLIRLTPTPTPTPPPPEYIRYEDPGGKFALTYPRWFAVELREHGELQLWGRGGYAMGVLVEAIEITEPGSAQDIMDFFKHQWARELPDYVPMEDKQFVLNGLPASRHVCQYTLITDLSSQTIVDVTTIVRRGNNVVFLQFIVFPEDYTRLRPVIERIEGSLVVK